MTSTTSTTSTTSPTIRRASREDLPSMCSLLEQAALPTVGVAEALGGFLVAETDGEIVGTVGIETCCDRYALLRSTAVADSWRGRGLGKRLVERAIGEAEANGFEALYLLTTTAERYFPSFGFSRIAREDAPAAVKASEQFTSVCCASAAVMTLKLAKST